MWPCGRALPSQSVSTNSSRWPSPDPLASPHPNIVKPALQTRGGMEPRPVSLDGRPTPGKAGLASSWLLGVRVRGCGGRPGLGLRTAQQVCILISAQPPGGSRPHLPALAPTLPSCPPAQSTHPDPRDHPRCPVGHVAPRSTWRQLPARVLGLVKKTPDLDPGIRSISGPHQGRLFRVLTAIVLC